MLKGLSVLGSADAPLGTDRKTDVYTQSLRRSLVAGYKLLLENHPEAAGAVAKHLSSWRVSALTDQLHKIRAQELKVSEKTSLALESYLAMADDFPRLAL